MIVRDAAGVEVLELGDTGLVDGYLAAAGFDEGQRSWRRTYHSAAARVDDEFEQTKARAKQRLTLPVYIEGTSVADVRAKHRALLAAVEADSWILDPAGDGTGGYWLCDAADSEPPEIFPGGLCRLVTFSIPASPGDGY